MTELVIRQSGKRGSGFVIAVLILAVLGFAKFASRIGRFEDAQESDQAQRHRVQQMLEQNRKDLEVLHKAFKEGDAVERFLESLPKSAPELPETESATTAPATDLPSAP